MAKTNMEKLNEIREYRNEQLKKLGDNSIFVTKVEVLGKGKNTGKEIFRLIEEKEIENIETGEFEKQISEFFYEHTDSPKLIAVRNPQTQGEIVPIGLDGDEKENWNIQKEEIEQCLEEREKEVKALAKMLGISEEEINSLSEIELSQKIEEERAEGNLEEEKDIEEDKPEQISEEEAKKIGINSMESVRTDTLVDSKGTTLGKELKLEEYTKIKVIHSYKLGELTDENGKSSKIHNMRFALIGQKADGTYERIPETKLRPYRGENRETTQIDATGKNVEVKREDCIFEVPGSNKRIAIDQKDPYGFPEVYYGKVDKGNEGIVMEELQNDRDGTHRSNVEVRALFNQNKGEYQIDKMHDEVQGHVEAGCKDLDKDEADGDLTTGHEHSGEDNVITPDTVLIYEGKEMPISEIAASSRFKISAEEFIEKYNEVTSHGEIETEEIYNEIEEQVNEEIRSPQDRKL